MSDQKLHFVQKPNYDRIGQDKVVRLKYALFDRDGDKALEYRDDLYYLHGGYGGAFPKVEAALVGLEVHAKAEVELTPEEAYGPRDPALLITQPVQDFPPEARQVGVQLDGEAPDGSSRPFVVTAVEADHITVDANHPLAGRHLRFVFEVLDIRNASDAELNAGYAFSPSIAGDSERH